jgi:hypothetical protein
LARARLVAQLAEHAPEGRQVLPLIEGGAPAHSVHNGGGEGEGGGASASLGSRPDSGLGIGSGVCAWTWAWA